MGGGQYLFFAVVGFGAVCRRIGGDEGAIGGGQVGIFRGGGIWGSVKTA